jgi:hypothetical protein
MMRRRTANSPVGPVRFLYDSCPRYRFHTHGLILPRLFRSMCRATIVRHGDRPKGENDA